MCSIVFRQSYTLQSVPPDISSTYLAPHIVIPILLTVFPMLYFISLWLFCTNLYFLFKFLSSFTDILSLLLERERGREREKHQRERETSIGCFPHMLGLGIIRAWARDRTCNLGMCPYWESNLHPFGYGMILQPTESHHPGPNLYFLIPSPFLPTLSVPHLWQYLFSVSLSLFQLCVFIYFVV